MSDLFSYTPKPQGAQTNRGKGDNTPTFSVGEISGALKKTIEGTFGHVRVRGELSRVTVAKSGHMYSSLKDESAVLDAVCWRGTMSQLSLTPEEGMDVICTGRLSTYPGRSSYQLIIESMELAGEGALLKMLEERKKKLAAEGLFADERKKPLPFLPQHIGIVTSPTGAVIRDILHRLTERFPIHVTLWPVMVQGQGAAAQIAKAVHGFNNLPHGFDTPDLLIVARGGGSLEDLMPFNEEEVVRAIAASRIPVISAVGHETDVTLCDFVADKRAPTPTGAAEMAVPVKRDLITTVENWATRGRNRIFDMVGRRLERLRDHNNALQRFPRSLETRQQRLDYAGTSLPLNFKSYVQTRDSHLHKLASRLPTPAQRLHDAEMRLHRLDPSAAFKGALQNHNARLVNQAARLLRPDQTIRQKERELTKSYEDFIRRRDKIIENRAEKLHASTRLLETLSFKNVLKRGYSVVRDRDGALIGTAAEARTQTTLHIEFADGKVKALPEDK